jgi:hypothetical protein
MDPNAFDNTDWVFSEHSNVHITNNKDQLTSYTAFTSTVKTHAAFGGSGNVPVEGLGSIALNLRLDKDDDATHKIIALADVLYVPKAICNIFSPKAYGDCLLHESGEMTTKEGKVIGETLDIEVGKICILWIEGKKGRDSTLVETGAIMQMHARWSEEERCRWEEFKKEKESEAK